ncbi:MAG: FG-GAP-like repeat-containing protein [Cyclobacteriaceae bacterium]
MNISKNTIIGFLLLITVNQSFAQVPYINSIEPTTGTFGETVTISGSNFSTNIADMEVRFGAAVATVTSATASLLEVTVPAGATTDNISVTNTSGSTVKTAYSNQLFHISFGGSKGVAGSFDPQVLVNDGPSDFGTYDLCLCDFDKDGLSDVAVTNNESQNIVIHDNNSTTSTNNFIRSQISAGFATINTVCGDLDGDGWPDLVATQGDASNNRIFIFRNQANGTVSFAAPITLTLPSDNGNLRLARRVSIQDLDLDGNPEIIVSNTSDNKIDVFKNNSIQGTITMNTTSQQFTMEASDTRVGGLVGLDVKDLNNDGLPEVVATFNRNSNVYVLPNSSQPGSISFESSKEFSASGAFQNLKVGDINQDGFNDVILTASNAGTPASAIVIVENKTASAGGSISMESAATISGISSPWGLDIGDVDGDGSVDIAVASVGSPGKIFVLLADNPTAFTFTTTEISTTSNSRNVKIGDLNGDGKPDLAFTHNVTSGSTGELSVVMNRNCVIPVITPSGNTDVCNGQVFTLTATNSSSATYTWKRNGIDQAETSNTLVVPTGGNGTFNFTVTVADQGCTQVSDQVTIVVEDGGITAPTPSSSPAGLRCSGDEVTLMAGQTYDSYVWTGPNGFTSTDQNPVISSISQNMSGKYKVFGRDANGCVSETKEVVVTVENLPVISVNNADEDIFCTGSSAMLSVTDFGSDYTYAWNKDGATTGQTGTTITVSESGNYSAIITSVANSCQFESPARTLSAIPVPSNSITSDPVSGLICEDLSIGFSTTAGDQNGQPVTHSWDYGDASPVEQGAAVSHTYADPATPTVTLTTIYTNITNCPSEISTKEITVQGVPNTTNGSTIAVTTGSGSTDKCPSEELQLSLGDTFTNYSWTSDLEPGTEYSTTNSMGAIRPIKGDPTVAYTVSATDAAGCDFTASIGISLKAAEGISITTLEETNVNDDGENEIQLDEDQLSVDLSVTNATGITWTPEEIFDNPEAIDVTAIPNDINILIKVFGTDPGGCLESDSIRVINPLVRAKRVFSPNGDGIGDECWEITNARSKLDGCTIFIFDSKGQVIKQEEISPQTDDCVWDGTRNGLLLPEGIYYYALKCVNNANVPTNLSGSILMGR